MILSLYPRARELL